MPYMKLYRRVLLRIVPARAGAAAPLLLALAAGIGCTSDNPMQGALRDSVGRPFGGPTLRGFQRLIESNCGQERVGGQSVASLMTSDTTFRQLTARLYRGDISKDAFTNMLLQEYPAADANIPATGCVADQLDICFNTRCDGTRAEPADAIAADEVMATRDEALQQVPPADRDAVDAMIDEADREAADRIGPLPSEDPGVMTGAPAAERVEKIGEPDKP
jgi:hypothetical protein